MLHLGKNTTSRIISKGIAAGHSNNTYRGLVSAHRRAKGARNFTNCDSLLIGNKCGAHTVPVYRGEECLRRVRARGHHLEDSEDTLFYCRSAACRRRRRMALVVNGFRQGRAAAAADGVSRSRRSKSDLDLAGRFRVELSGRAFCCRRVALMILPDHLIERPVEGRVLAKDKRRRSRTG
jgi:hypothetical protein